MNAKAVAPRAPLRTTKACAAPVRKVRVCAQPRRLETGPNNAEALACHSPTESAGARAARGGGVPKIRR